MKKVQLKVNHLKYDENKSFLIQYLESLGISDEAIPSFINKAKETDIDDWHKLDNMETAVQQMRTWLDMGSKVFVQVDSDTDGYTSAAILINYLQKRYPENEIVWRLHNGKEHGVIVDTVPQDCKIVVIPDAGSNQVAEQKQLVAQGKLVIVLDHHEVEHYEPTGAIIVNNQMSKDFKNKNLSGAGVAYMFINAFDDLIFGHDKLHEDYRDLAAIGIIADAMNMSTVGNNYFAYYGLNNIKNQFIAALAKKQDRGGGKGIKDPQHLTKIDVAFYIAPTINGCIRGGSAEDKQTMFKAIMTSDSDEEFITTYRGTTRTESLYDYAVRLACNAKSRQDAAKKKGFEWLCDKIRAEGWDKHNIIIAPLEGSDTSKITPNLTGLVAMELVKEFNKPCLVLRETMFDNQDVFGGSGRNGNFYGLPGLKDFLHEAGIYYAEGHQNAFGAFLLQSQINSIRKYADEHLNNSVFEDKVYEVDYIFHSRERIDLQMLGEFAKHENLWGQGMPAPLFAFEVNYTDQDFRFMGEKKNSVRLTHDGVNFVALADNNIAQLFHDNPNGHATIIGMPMINEYNGNISIQIKINDIYLTDAAPVVNSIFDLI